MDDALATLVSVPFAVAVTALLRKRWPAIDGGAVYGVVLILTCFGSVLGHFRSQIPPEVWTAAAPLLGTILAIGGVQTAQHVARGVAILPVVVSDDRPTVPPSREDLDP